MMSLYLLRELGTQILIQHFEQTPLLEDMVVSPGRAESWANIHFFIYKLNNKFDF